MCALYAERIYEDHENLVENLLLWTRDSSNRILFLEREEKYDLFVNPEVSGQPSLKLGWSAIQFCLVAVWVKRFT